MSKTVLVTGATGFIGRALVGALKGQGTKVIALGSRDGDIADERTLGERFMAGLTGVVHLAGKSFIPDSWKDPAAFTRVNTEGTIRVLEFCKGAQVPLVHVSAYIYGVPDRLPISEDAPARPNNPYALSKFLAEEQCRFYHRDHGLPVTILRPFNVYGPGQDDRFLIPKIVSQLSSKQIQVLDLSPRRDYVHRDDLVRAILAAMQQIDGYNVFNIGGGISLSVEEVIGVVQSAAGTQLQIRSQGKRRAEEIPDVRADISRAAAGIGWTPEISFEQGIADLVRGR